MALQVTTKHLRKFRRAEIEFSATPTIVGEDELARITAGGKTVKEAILGEPMLQAIELSSDKSARPKR